MALLLDTQMPNVGNCYKLTLLLNLSLLLHCITIPRKFVKHNSFIVKTIVSSKVCGWFICIPIISTKTNKHVTKKFGEVWNPLIVKIYTKL